MVTVQLTWRIVRDKGLNIDAPLPDGEVTCVSAYPAHGCLTLVTGVEPRVTRYIPLDKIEEFTITEDADE